MFRVCICVCREESIKNEVLVYVFVYDYMCYVSVVFEY